MKARWDDFDRLGRENYRLKRSAERHLKDAYRRLEKAQTDVEREEIRKTIEAWSLTEARHSREIAKLLKMKYKVATDNYGAEGWAVVHDPDEKREEDETKKREREGLRLIRGLRRFS